MESATSFRAAILSSSLVRIVVVRGGISSRGLVGGVSSSWEDVGVRASEEDMMEREDGGRV